MGDHELIAVRHWNSIPLWERTPPLGGLARGPSPLEKGLWCRDLCILKAGLEVLLAVGGGCDRPPDNPKIPGSSEKSTAGSLLAVVSLSC